MHRSSTSFRRRYTDCICCNGCNDDGDDGSSSSSNNDYYSCSNKNGRHCNGNSKSSCCRFSSDNAKDDVTVAMS